MILFRTIIVAICVFLVNSSSQNAFAAGSGAYAVETPDAGAMGKGSAFVGEANTPAAIYYNPAGINQIKRFTISVGDAVIAPRAHYKTTAGDAISERNNEYNIPNFYAVIPIIPSKLSVGFGSGSYWGLGTNWAPDSALRYATTQASIKDIDNSLVAAYQVTDQWSLAVSADNDYSKVDESKRFPNPGFADGGIEARGGNDAWGYRLATMFKINDQNQIGLMYRSRINHNYTGKIIVDGISSDYAAYGLNNTFITNIEEKSVLPQSVVLGYSFKPISKWTINADLEWMDWSSTKYQTVSYPNATPSQLAFLNLGGNPTPQNWHSVWSESVGTEYAATDRLRLRAGYYHHQSPIPPNNFNPALPDSSSNAFSTGFGYDLNPRLTLDVAYSGLIFRTRNITNSVSNAFGGSVNGKYSQYVNIGLVSLTYKF